MGKQKQKKKLLKNIQSSEEKKQESEWVCVCGSNTAGESATQPWRSNTFHYLFKVCNWESFIYFNFNRFS